MRQSAWRHRGSLQSRFLAPVLALVVVGFATVVLAARGQESRYEFDLECTLEIDDPDADPRSIYTLDFGYYQNGTRSPLYSRRARVIPNLPTEVSSLVGNLTFQVSLTREPRDPTLSEATPLYFELLGDVFSDGVEASPGDVASAVKVRVVPEEDASGSGKVAQRLTLFYDGNKIFIFPKHK